MNQYSVRQYIIGAIIALVFFIYLIRLFYIQIIDSSYKYSAENNSQRYVTQYPARGLIYDRNGELLVCNDAAYDLMVNRQELKTFDTAELASIVGLDIEQFNKILNKIKKNNEYIFKTAPFLSQLPDSAYAILQEKIYKYPGFFVQPRTLRKYNKKIAAHLFGYVGEVDSSIIKRKPYYRMGDYIGMSGMEKAYEEELRGKKGVSILLVDVHNRVKGSFQNGRFDTASIVGLSLTTTIDARIQEYGEKLMQKFRGSIVAIEPATGEVLALVSAPSYDPQLLVGRTRRKNVGMLQQDPRQIWFNRALMAKYPPGSTFKLINTLVGLKEGVVSENTSYSCYLGYTSGRVHVGCHPHPSPYNLTEAIQHSCNGYFCQEFRKIIEDPRFMTQAEAYANWRNTVLSFGFGKKFESDFPNELSGNIPSASYYNKIYGKNGWKSLTVISLAIGQGEIGITPLQMANMVSTIANRGYYYLPHTVKNIQGGPPIDMKYTTKHNTLVPTEHFNLVVKGMEMAVNGPGGGTAIGAAIPDIIVCGKTGTAQNPHGEDHSIFIAFAPKDNPKIAIAVYVENAGFGATYAAPIASLLIEKYLKDTVSRPWLEERLLNANLKY
jgi:penicillin-binding protein 2